jgi:endonuclease-3 related protein
MFEICAGAILTQNTAWTNARTALAGLGAARALSPSRLAVMPSVRLCRLIRSSGFYRQKAARLKGFSAYLLSSHPEGLENWFSGADAGELRTELLKIKGIGPETADSMLLYAGRKAKFVVDAYTHRIFGRLGLITGSYAVLQEAFERALPRDHRSYNEYHALIVALGKDYCRKTGPFCRRCPLKELCVRRGVLSSR